MPPCGGRSDIAPAQGALFVAVVMILQSEAVAVAEKRQSQNILIADAGIDSGIEVGKLIFES